jgi:tyrosine-protein phosphatase YwqE
MEVAAQYNLIVATGHLAAEEGLAVIKAAKSHGVEKIITTHADNPADYYSLEQQLACVKEGAIIEHSFLNRL